MNKHIFLFLILLSFMILVLVLFYFGVIRLNYPSHDDYPIRGIDISHHQGNIRWNELSKENLDFIFIKATEGGDWIDSKFFSNIDSANNYFTYVGAYHYYRLCKNGQEQAEHFINTIYNIELNLPPVIDLEYHGNCETNKSKQKIIKEIINFLTLLEKKIQKTPIIYTTNSFYKDFINNRFEQYPIWIRDIFCEPNLNNGRKWMFWQYSDKMNVNGISGFVDMNVFNGSKNEFNAWVNSIE